MEFDTNALRLCVRNGYCFYPWSVATTAMLVEGLSALSGGRHRCNCGRRNSAI